MKEKGCRNEKEEDAARLTTGNEWLHCQFTFLARARSASLIWESTSEAEVTAIFVIAIFLLEIEKRRVF